MKLIKFLFVCLFIVITLYAISITKMFFANDISTEPIDPQSNVDFSATTYKPRMPVYLVSYVDGKEVFFKNQNTLVLSGLNKGIDFFLNYRKSLFDEKFIDENKYILSQKRGAGYWLWKPYVILHALETVPENSIVIYADSGFVFINSVLPFVKLAEKHDIVLIEYDTPTVGPIGKVTQRKTLESMDCDTKECREGKHLWAAFQVFKNTLKSREFVKKWLELCKNPDNVMEAKSDKPNHPEFRHHQHDEAVLSVFLHKEPEGKYLFPFTEFLNYVEWHHRHPGEGREYMSILPEMKKQIRGFEREMLSSKIMMAIRKYILRKSKK